MKIGLWSIAAVINTNHKIKMHFLNAMLLLKEVILLLMLYFAQKKHVSFSTLAIFYERFPLFAHYCLVALDVWQ